MYGLPLNRGRLYFIGAEVFDYVSEYRTGNDEATMDRLSLQARRYSAHVVLTDVQQKLQLRCMV